MINKARSLARQYARRHLYETDWSKYKALSVGSGDTAILFTENETEVDEEIFKKVMETFVFLDVSFVSEFISCLAHNDLEFNSCNLIYVQFIDYLGAFRLSSGLRKHLETATPEYIDSFISVDAEPLIAKYRLTSEQLLSEMHEFLAIDPNEAVFRLIECRKEAIDFANEYYQFLDSSSFEDPRYESFAHYAVAYSYDESIFVNRFLDQLAGLSTLIDCKHLYIHKKFLATKMKELDNVNYKRNCEIMLTKDYIGFTDFETKNTLTPDKLSLEMEQLIGG